MKKFALGLAALLTIGMAGTAVAQEVTPTEDNDVNVSDNQVVIVQCIQNQEVVDTQTVVVGGEDETPTDAPAVEAVKESFAQQNCNVNVYVKSDVVTPTSTPSATPTPIVVTNTVTKETVREVTVNNGGATVPEGAPNTGFGPAN